VTIQTQSCPNCGTQPFAGATYCHHCGAAISPAAERLAGAVPWDLGDIGKAIGIVVIVLIATSIPVALVATAIAGDTDIEQDPTALTIAIGASAFLELALLGTAIHFSLRKYGASLAYLGLRPPERGGFWLSLGIGFGLLMAGLGVNFAYFAALSAVGIDPDVELPEEVFQNPGPLITIGILSLLFAPLMEEIFFRGFVFGGLRPRWGVLWAAIASGALFAVAHIGNPGTIYLIVPVAAIGAIFAWGYFYTGSLLASFVAHFLFNLVAFVAGTAEHS
jgi:membrane protease YdiL (CAAX protease family)